MGVRAGGGDAAKKLIPVCLSACLPLCVCARAVGAVRVMQGASGLEDVGFGIKKLRITCVVEDDKVDALLPPLCYRMLRQTLHTRCVTKILGHALRTGSAILNAAPRPRTAVGFVYDYCWCLPAKVSRAAACKKQLQVGREGCRWCARELTCQWACVRHQVSVDALEEKITNLEDLVQSVDVAAMNKI